MGNSGSRPSCLGERGQKAQDFLKDSYLKDVGLAAGSSAGRNNVEGRLPPPEKMLPSPVVIENGWSMGVGTVKGQPSSPLPKQNNTDVEVQNRSLSSNPLKAHLEATWSPQRGLEPQRCSGGSWLPKAFATTEVTEVTEVTETVVTEIVEVTEYPGGDRSQQPIITRTVKVLSEGPGILTEGAATFPEDSGSPEESQVTLKKLLLWVGDMEDLMASQKPLSSEVKVVEAQLQEQKLLRRLLDERRPHVELLLLQGQKGPPGAFDGREGSRGEAGGLRNLQQKWMWITQEAEARLTSLERVLPTAQAFQESVNPFQDWLGLTERSLAQLWQIANGSLSRTQDTCQQIQELCEEVRAKPGELERALEHGQRLLEVVSGEEAHLTQEKMDSLRMRFLIVGQSSTDVLHRLEQSLEVSCQLDSSQEDLGLWLGRLEKEVLAQDPYLAHRPSSITAADKEKFEQVLRSELARGSHLSSRLEELDPVPLEAHTICLQLASLKTLSAEILHHSDLTERLVAMANPLLSSCTPDMQQQLQPLVQFLPGQAEALRHQSSACTMRLEHAQSLLAQFKEAQEELQPWLQETQSTMGQLSLESVSWEAFREQQEALQCLREAVAEHKPLVAKLQRLSGLLADVNPQEADAFQQSWQAAEEQYSQIREHVHQAAAVMEEAIPRYSQLCERMQLMVESLELLQSRMQHPPHVRGDTAWLQEQIRENSLRLADLEKLGVALETLRGQGAELQATMETNASIALQDRVEQLLSQWQVLWMQGEERESWLRGLLALADPFWHRLSQLALMLSETQRMVMDPEELPSDAAAIKARLQAMQALREEIDALQTELDSLGILGTELVSSCGDLDKPDVTRSLDDLYSSWNDLSRVWTERQACLEEQLQVSLTYQETMKRLLGWLEAAELRITEEFLLEGDLELVKQQLLKLKDFKRELYQCKVDAESLRHPLSPRGKGPPTALSSFRARWCQLEDEVACRQHQLESALLGLGQFQSQLQELLHWLQHTAEQLQGTTPLSLDLQSCEIELAKHKVLRNDVLSRARTVHSVKEAGQGLLLSRVGGSTEGLQSSLQQLSQCWDVVLGETESRQLELENNLSQAQDLTLEITDLLRWLEHVELQLFCSKPTWGTPEAMKDSLAAHLELCKDMESKQEAYRGIQDRFQQLLATTHPPRASSTRHCLGILEQKWESVTKQVKERKEQLHEGLMVSTAFHSTTQELLEWVTQTEETLETLPPPSCVLETVARQIEEQKSLLQEGHSQSATLAGLESTAARMRDFSWKQQECSVAHSLLLAAKERLVKVLQRVGERGAALEDARRRAKQFRESWQLLLAWLDEVAEVALEEPSEAARSQEEIKSLLFKHKDFQKGLRTKRPVYEATLRSGRLLCEKALLPEDSQRLDEMLAELKDRWGGACSRAAERQRRLEEELLFSGRFTDTLQALMDWLYRAEPQLAEESPVAGDRDLVSALMDKHKVFQKELGQRAGCVKALRRSVRELTRGSSIGDSQWLQSQIEELGQRWELVCRLSVSKQDRLEAALRQAEEFHELVQTFLSRLCELERSVKYGSLPEEEAAVQQSQAHLKELMESLQCQRLQLECLSSLAEEILISCHPDSVITIRSWVTVAKSRFQEVLSWAQQQDERLRAQAALLTAEREEEARLTDWITAAEESLSLRDQEPLPDDAEQLEELSSQHAVFMEELNLKQADVEKASRSCMRKVPAELRATPAAHKPSARRRGSGKSYQEMPAVPPKDLEPQPPALSQLVHRWQQLWLLALDRQYRLQNAQQRLQEVEDFAHFDFTVWRKRYLQWISRMKSRVLDVFRGIDRDQDGRITHQEFIESVLLSKFPTNTLEMNAVAGIFDTNRDGFIDYYEFVSVLHPSRDMLRKGADADQIQDEVNRQVAQCNCAKRFQVEQISANRYRFGESQQLRMVRILRSTLMVRVGGGWVALDEFLVKNDPCRVKGRTNLKINEKYLSVDPAGSKGPLAGPSKALSPSHSYSSLYSSASAPSSPLPRKSVLRRTRSGDRCLHPRSSVASDGAEPIFPGAAEAGVDLGAEPPDHPEGPPP